MRTLTANVFAIILAAFISTNASAVEKKDLPKTIIIKKDQDGTFYVHRSATAISKVDQSDVKKLDKLKFEKVSNLSEILNVDSLASQTEELDRDLPRQSWYIAWGGYYGYYYPYYPVYYYNYSYYPYYNYGYRGCNYYWYGYY